VTKAVKLEKEWNYMKSSGKKKQIRKNEEKDASEEPKGSE